jgi:hypothetical protein
METPNRPAGLCAYGLASGQGRPLRTSITQALGITIRRRSRIERSDPSRTASYAVVRDMPSSRAASVTDIVAASGLETVASSISSCVKGGSSSKLNSACPFRLLMY